MDKLKRSLRLAVLFLATTCFIMHAGDAVQQTQAAAAVCKEEKKVSQVTVLKNSLFYMVMFYIIQEIALFSHECGHTVVGKILHPDQSVHISINLSSFGDINPQNELFRIGNFHVHNNPVPLSAGMSYGYLPDDFQAQIVQEAKTKLEPQLVTAIDNNSIISVPQAETIKAAVYAAKDTKFKEWLHTDFLGVKGGSKNQQLAFYAAGGISAIITMYLVSIFNAARIRRHECNSLGQTFASGIKNALTPFENVLTKKGLTKKEVIYELLLGCFPLLTAIQQLTYVALPIMEGGDGPICWELILGKKPKMLGGRAVMEIINIFPLIFMIYKSYKTYKKYFENAAADAKAQDIKKTDDSEMLITSAEGEQDNVSKVAICSDIA